jgi:hypothetical protein
VSRSTSWGRQRAREGNGPRASSPNKHRPGRAPPSAHLGEEERVEEARARRRRRRAGGAGGGPRRGGGGGVVAHLELLEPEEQRLVLEPLAVGVAPSRRDVSASAHARRDACPAPARGARARRGAGRDAPERAARDERALAPRGRGDEDLSARGGRAVARWWATRLPQRARCEGPLGRPRQGLRTRRAVRGVRPRAHVVVGPGAMPGAAHRRELVGRERVGLCGSRGVRACPGSKHVTETMQQPNVTKKGGPARAASAPGCSARRRRRRSLPRRHPPRFPPRRPPRPPRPPRHPLRRPRPPRAPPPARA